MTDGRVVLKPRKAQPFYQRHPWVFPGAIEQVEGNPADGEVVEVVSHRGHFIARGLYNAQSKIRVRLYTWEVDQALDRSFWFAKLTQALTLRQTILGLVHPEASYRLVSSEADGLSGCTIDVYGAWITVQFTSLGLAQRAEILGDALEELLQPKGIYLRTERGVGQLEGLMIQDGPLRGPEPPVPVVIQEHGLAFGVNLREGQKTGFFLDQRDNRRVVAAYGRGCRVLDGFCYTGGFSLHLARAGAGPIVAVDGSRTALNLARDNAQQNQLSGIDWVHADVFDDLAGRAERDERFGLVILDPPKFARSKAGVPEALRGYRRLVRLALRILVADGILVLCCCTGSISMPMLEEVLAQMALREHRGLQLLERRGPAPDHPVNLSCPESTYLKCLILRVL